MSFLIERVYEGLVGRRAVSIWNFIAGLAEEEKVDGGKLERWGSGFWELLYLL